MSASPAAPRTRINDAFSAARQQNRTAFMPFLTAGDPDLQATLAVIRRLASTGVDLIEVGFPYSDPIADGPIIQASYTRALGRKITIDQIFAEFTTLDSKSLPPLVAMVSYAIVLRRGMTKFLDDAARAGFSGFIIPDLPAAEAGDVFQAVRERQLDLIQLIAPTTDRKRVREILSACSGFLYCLAVAGITGEREQVADALLSQLEWLKTETEVPLAAGFGISRPEHVATLRHKSDGVIVGSALVRKLEGADPENLEPALASIESFARSMIAACKS